MLDFVGCDVVDYIEDFFPQGYQQLSRKIVVDMVRVLCDTYSVQCNEWYYHKGEHDDPSKRGRLIQLEGPPSADETV